MHPFNPVSTTMPHRRRALLTFVALAALLALLFAASSARNAHALPTCSTTCYVANAPLGNDLNDGLSPSTPLEHIQTAVLQLPTGGTVIVAAGTYNESVTITANITLHGAQAGHDARSGRGLPPSPTTESVVTGVFSIAGDNVTVDGFAFVSTPPWSIANGGWDGLQVDNNIFQGDSVGVYDSTRTGIPQSVIQHNLFDSNDTGVWVSSPLCGGCVTKNVSIYQNAFSNSTNTGILVDGGLPNTQDTSITFNTSQSDLAFLSIYASTGTTASYNTIEYGGNWGIIVSNAASGANVLHNQVYHTPNAIGVGDLATDTTIEFNRIWWNSNGVLINANWTGSGLTIARNDFTDNVPFAVNNTSSTTVDATCNWWEVANGPGGAGTGTGDPISANVLFQPWLTSNNLQYAPCDHVAPTVNITKPAMTPAQVIAKGAYVVPSYSCFDSGGAGIATCKPSSYSLPTGTVGPQTFTVTATDKAGNITTKSVNYTVADRSQCAGTGWQSFTIPKFYSQAQCMSYYF